MWVNSASSVIVRCYACCFFERTGKILRILVTQRERNLFDIFFTLYKQVFCLFHYLIILSIIHLCLSFIQNYIIIS